MLIPGVEIRPLDVIADDRGAVLHMLRADAPHFQRFGEIYFSIVNPGAVKAWRRHRSAVMNLAVPVGEAVIAMFDDRSDSPARGVAMDIPAGRSNYCLITIPAGVWSGFMAVGDVPAVIANCATGLHDPAEVDRRPADDPAIPYIWSPRGRG
jgi:dTDP-4-dehydrorhamnose 3,5-epimerase